MKEITITQKNVGVVLKFMQKNPSNSDFEKCSAGSMKSGSKPNLTHTQNPLEDKLKLFKVKLAKENQLYRNFKH